MIVLKLIMWSHYLTVKNTVVYLTLDVIAYLGHGVFSNVIYLVLLNSSQFMHFKGNDSKQQLLKK